MTNYRLRPKPGVVKSGRTIKTSQSPVIVISQKNPTPVPKIPESQKVQKVVIKKPPKNPVRAQRPQRNVRPRSSALKRKKELDVVKYRKAIGELKDSGKGRILIMVACGPSILEADLPKLKGHPLIDFMSINKPDPRLHETKYWVFCDQSQYTRNQELFKNYKGTLINAWSVRARHPNQVLIKNISGKGFSKDLSKGYYIGRSTTFANMQTAHWLNYDQTYIFGCDMSKKTDLKKLHFYGVNPDVKPELRITRFTKEADHFMLGAKRLSEDERKKFTFCSSYNEWPFVDQYNRLDHKEAVDAIFDRANQMLEQK